MRTAGLFCFVFMVLVGGLIGARPASAEMALVRLGYGSTIALHRGPSERSPEIARIPAGVNVRVVQRSGQFARVRVGGEAGFVLTRNLELGAYWAVIPRRDGVIGYYTTEYPHLREMLLEYGTVVVARPIADRLASVEWDGPNGRVQVHVSRNSLAGCRENSFAEVSSFQRSLDRLGFDPGGADGRIGPRTLRALTEFLRDRGAEGVSERVEANDAAQIGCAAALVHAERSRVEAIPVPDLSDPRFAAALDAALMPSGIRMARRRAQRAYDARECERLDDYTPVVLGAISRERCDQLRSAEAELSRRREQEAAARAAFEARDCDAVANIERRYQGRFTFEACIEVRETEAALAHRQDQEARAAAAFQARECEVLHTIEAEYLGRNTPTVCEALRARERGVAQLQRHIEAGECERADTISVALGAYQAVVARCYESERLAAMQADYDRAVQAGDCDAVEDLGRALGVTGDLETCRLNEVMNAPSARAMFLAAVRYETTGQIAQARQIYDQIIVRFPEDDDAFQAGMRLLALNDAAERDREQEEMQAELQRLRAESREARRAAQAAQSEAERARTAASRRPPEPSYPGGFRPGDRVFLCMRGGNHIPATVVSNPSGSQMEVRVEREFFLGSIFAPTTYYRNRDYFFDRDVFSVSRSGCR